MTNSEREKFEQFVRGLQPAELAVLADQVVEARFKIGEIDEHTKHGTLSELEMLRIDDADNYQSELAEAARKYVVEGWHTLAQADMLH